MPAARDLTGECRKQGPVHAIDHYDGPLISRDMFNGTQTGAWPAPRFCLTIGGRQVAT